MRMVIDVYFVSHTLLPCFFVEYFFLNDCLVVITSSHLAGIPPSYPHTLVIPSYICVYDKNMNCVYRKEGRQI